MGYSISGTHNRIELIGRLGQDPDLKYTRTGKAVVNISLATNEKSGQGEVTSWHRVTFWEKKAEAIAQYCQKGSRIRIAGTLGYRKYTDSNGIEKIAAEIDGQEMTLLDSKENNGGGQSRGGGGGSYGGQDNGRGSGGGQGSRGADRGRQDEIPYSDDEDIPF